MNGDEIDLIHGNARSLSYRSRLENLLSNDASFTNDVISIYLLP